MMGHCSKCRKIWTLETGQGLCQWCGKLAIRQTTQTQALRSIKSRSNGRKRQIEANGNGYDQLEGEWALYYRITSYFTRHIRYEDKEDWLHDTMLEIRLSKKSLCNHTRVVKQGIIFPKRDFLLGATG